MYKRNTSSWLKHWDFIVLDLIILQIAFLIAYMLRNGMDNPYDNLLYRNTALIIGLLGLCLGFFMENYRGILRRGYWKEFQAVAKHIGAITAGVIIYLFMMKVSGQYSRLAMAYFPFIAGLMSYFGRIILKKWLKSHMGPASGKRGIMLIGAKKNYIELVNNFRNNPFSEFRVVGIAVIDECEENRKEYIGIPILTGKEAILDYLRSTWVDEVLFSIPKDMPLPDDLIDKCNIMGITVHLKLARLENGSVNQFIEQIEGYTVLSSSINMATPGQLFMKRIMDITGGIIGLLCTGIIFVIIAPIIYIKSPGPIFFTQVRVGKNGRRFKIYKFRSMYMDAEERKKELSAQNNIKDGMMFKMDHDPRIIRGIGNFIREYSIDEFPQFWNVLKGEMSLVGTRPPTVDEWEKYDLHHRTRLAIKPGLTGMWQVSGRSEITDFEEVVKLDTKYIREWNFGLDVKILLKTILVVLGKEGSM